MKAYDIKYKDVPEKAEGVEDEYDIPDGVTGGIFRAEKIRPCYNFLMGYTTGVLRKWWCGIEGIYFVFMGAWNDPYIVYKGYAFNVYTIEDAICDMYDDEYGDPGCGTVASAEYTEKGFIEYAKSKADDIYEMLDDMLLKLKEDISTYISGITGIPICGFSLKD